MHIRMAYLPIFENFPDITSAKKIIIIPENIPVRPNVHIKAAKKIILQIRIFFLK